MARAERLDTTLLGQVPLFPEIRAGGDAGAPVVVANPAGEAAKVFAAIGRELLQRLPAKPAAS